MGLEIGTAKAVAEAAIDVISKAHKQGWLDKLISALRNKHRVLVLGATGAGKTAFLESLTETIPKAIESMNRAQFNEKYRIKISKDLFIFTDTPGQHLHTRRRQEAFREVLKMKGGVAGIINVVSSGYHEASTVEFPTIKASTKVPESFLEQRREVEIAMLEEWRDLLGGAESAKWPVTVVTKADLWWRQREGVLDYYRSGQYHQALGEAQNLKPVVLEYCSIFQKFYGQIPMSGDFQDSDRIRVKAQMIRTLLAAIGREHNG